MMTNLNTDGGTGGTNNTMNGGISKRARGFGEAWRGAAAYHFYMLAQRQFYKGTRDLLSIMLL